MVAIADINDRESLQAWLEETNQPREACVVLAHRAAMREVLKTLTWSAQYEHSALPILRALLVSCVFAKLLVSRGTDTETLLELESAAKNAGAAAAYSASADPVFARYYLAADALLVASGEPNRYGSDTDIDWSGVQEDCVKILDGIELFESAIESSTTTKAKFFLLPPTGLPAHWRFWIDWYERALAGEPQPWRLLKEIALKEDAFWQGSDDEVMARINEFVERDSLAASFNAEELEYNEQRQRIEARTHSDIDTKPLQIALDRLRDAVDELRDTPAFANQYTALDRELRRIDDHLARYSETPLRIYEVCVRTCRQIDLKVKEGSLPDADPVLEDFKTEVDNTALDLLGSDPQVAEAVRVRNSARFDRLTDTEKEHFRAITPQITPICEEGLARELQDDIATATDESASPDDQKDARFRWGSRMLRIFRIIRSGVGDYANYLTIANSERGGIANWFL